MENPRELRGLAILARGNQIKRLDATSYRVKSQNGNGSYLVLKEAHDWNCECADHKFRDVVCKHIHSVIFSQTLRDKVSSQSFDTGQIFEEPDSCKVCGSFEIVKNAFRKNKYGKIQTYKCKSCGHRFSVNYGFKKMRNDPKVITLVMDLYFKGVSLRKISDHLKQFYNVSVSQVSVLKWIKKYIAIMKEYLDEFTPQVGNKWHVDEMRVSIKGEWKWLWNLMDNETRFLLSSQVSNKREIMDARKVMQEAKMKAKIRPNEVVTDGLQSYTQAFKDEFSTDGVKHLRKPRFTDIANNNLVERLQCSIREREKTMRGLKKKDSVFVEGHKIYYNHIRPHSSLNGKTPAEACGIGIKGRNRWITIIQNAKTKVI